jgi:glycosyltransferase involved in cell wall biosynthesis
LLSSNHQYPVSGDKGSGLHPKPFPSGSGGHIHDLLAKGLSELGHEVFYLLPQGASKPLPAGVLMISEPAQEVDILHRMAYRDDDLVQHMKSQGKPWVTTCHLDHRARSGQFIPSARDWIFVSRTMAQSYGSDRYVLNGIDPADYIYSETKKDYLLFMSSIDWAMDKGLDDALRISDEAGLELIVAGTSRDYPLILEVDEMCKRSGAKYVGDVRGQEKAALLAGAKAFLFPSKVNEAFGLGMVEALMSGTPVVCSDKGAIPEIISADVGFVCHTHQDYLEALNRVDEISPAACRDKAMKDYHYLRMTADYLREYEKEIACHTR